MSQPKLIDNQAETLEREALDGLYAAQARLARLVEDGPTSGKLARRAAQGYIDLRNLIQRYEDATDDR